MKLERSESVLFGRGSRFAGGEQYRDVATINKVMNQLRKNLQDVYSLLGVLSESWTRVAELPRQERDKRLDKFYRKFQTFDAKIHEYEKGISECIKILKNG